MSDGFTETRHRSKKNTRRWCRGKRGVEHQWDKRIRRPLFGLQVLPRPCAWNVIFYAGDVRRPRPVYSCRHEWVCTECGKTMHLMAKECPQWFEVKTPVEKWTCAECGHAMDAPHGSRMEPCLGECECRRFWVYPRGEAAR